MRRVRNVRHLAGGETQEAQKVYQATIPYDQVLISDGSGGGNRPFTLPTRVPTSMLFNVDSAEGKYVIHAGDGYYGLTRSNGYKNTLIHELAHVWQGEHWSSPYWVNSLGMQAAWALAGALDKLGGYDEPGDDDDHDAYAYDKVDLWDWDDYHAEQQAQIIEDWYKGGMKKNPDDDFRFYYVRRHIWGVKTDPDWLETYRQKRVPHPEPLERATLKEFYIANMDGYLLPVLQPRFAANDVAGFGKRVKTLEGMFRRLRSEQACELVSRLSMHRAGDKVSEAFRGNLSTAARNQLLTVLRNRCRGTDL